MLLAVAEHEGIKSEFIPRIASGFCGGIAYTGDKCGAVSGGIMAIGLLLGRNLPTDRKEPCYEAVRVFLKKFEGRFGSLLCPELTGVDLSTPEGHAEFWSRDLIKECTNYMGEAARWVVDGL